MNSIYNKINTFFSSEHANKTAIVCNRLSLILYKTAYPTAKVFARLSIKPNTVTWLSVFFTLIAAFTLFFKNDRFFFILFWMISVHLDFTDGTLARMTRQVSKSAFRIDHMTDLVKLFIVFLAVGIFYNSFFTWIFVISAIFCLMYSEILSHELKFYFKRQADRNEQFLETTISESNFVKSLLGNSPLLISFLRNINSIFFSISGHTLIFFCILPFGEAYANGFIFYFTAICIYGLSRAIKNLSVLKR